MRAKSAVGTRLLSLLQAQASLTKEAFLPLLDTGTGEVFDFEDEPCSQFCELSPTQHYASVLS